jgi:aromatic amino acid aminotransferase I
MVGLRGLLWVLLFASEAEINIGNPHHSLYSISQIDFHVPRVDSSNPLEVWKAQQVNQESSSLQTFSSFKDKDCALNLRAALQYGSGSGTTEVRQILARLNQIIHSPPHNTVTLSLGNMDSAAKCFRLFGNPGDSFLAEEFSFPGVTNAPIASGINWVPVKMDGEGIIPQSLEEVLANWDESVQGRAPHLLYVVP